MAEDDKKTGVGAEASKLAETLTRYPDSEIFKQDNTRYYQQGNSFRELDGIRDGKLLEGLKAAKEDKKPTPVQQDAMMEAAKLVVDGKKAVEGKSTKVASVPLARLVEAANQYYEMGDNKNGDILINYAVNQSEAIDKQNNKKEDSKITTELKEYKAAVDGYYKGEGQEKGTPKVSIDPKMEALLAGMDKVQAGSTNASLPAEMGSKVRGV